ncbi:hypothetical protein [Microbacterium hibisci]|uniref:hypothetical protein n=1 Tax=Microbacterium hibisci TaxID=2036000 RepID=UPI001943920D|nr:hypothetical protein [Microbacterium hibisci]
MAVGSLLLVLLLAGCATPVAGAGIATPEVISEPGASSEPSASSEPTAPLDAEVAAAQEQAQAWLDAATLPPGAVRSDVTIGGFTSYTGWPCGPVEEIEAFWTIPDATVSDTANWLREHPTADLITTAFAPAPDDPAIDSAMVGYIPAADSQEGIVYTIVKKDGGVAVRAEIAAQTESAVCPPLPDGAMYGAPGQG